MKIGVPRETHPGERRVATTPEVATQLQKLGYEVVVETGAGAEASFSDDAATLAGAPFDAVVSTEVVEHLYAPHELIRFSWEALKPGGHLILTTPYDGYLKNLALAVTGKES